MSSYIFDRKDVNVKSFNAVYELTDIFDIDLDRVILSAPVICNKNDERYVIGYKRMDGSIIPLYAKSPINCHSNGVNRYNENSTWKMGWIFPMLKNGWKCTNRYGKKQRSS